MTVRDDEDRELIDKLEAQQKRIDELEETVEKMIPSRRDVLGGAAAGLLGLGGGAAASKAAKSAVEPAAAQTSDGDGDVGTPTNRVDVYAELVDAGRRNINNHAAFLEKTTNQALSANTDTTVDWDNSATDSVLSYDATADTITVEEAGDYRVDVQIRYINIADGNVVWGSRLFVNGSIEIQRRFPVHASPSDATMSKMITDLSAGDTIRIDARATASCDVDGGADRTFAAISKVA